MKYRMKVLHRKWFGLVAKTTYLDIPKTSLAQAHRLTEETILFAHTRGYIKVKGTSTEYILLKNILSISVKENDDGR